MAIYTALTRNMNFGFKRHNGFRFVLQGTPTLLKHQTQHPSARNRCYASVESTSRSLSVLPNALAYFSKVDSLMSSA